MKSRCQINLIDKQSNPDKGFNFIMVDQNRHFYNFFILSKQKKYRINFPTFWLFEAPLFA